MTLHLQYSQYSVSSYVDINSTSAVIKNINIKLHVHLNLQIDNFQTHMSNTVSSLQIYLLTTSNLKRYWHIWNKPDLFVISFTSHPWEKLPRCIIKYITSWFARGCWKGAMPHLKAEAQGRTQLSDQNQPPAQMAMPKYCVLSKYLILTLCWKLIKYHAGGKTSAE